MAKCEECGAMLTERVRVQGVELDEDDGAAAAGATEAPAVSCPNGHPVGREHLRVRGTEL